MKRNLVFLFLLVAVVACDKDKFQTKPQIQLKSQNTSTVDANESLRLVIEFTDKEGDVNDTLYIKKERLNRRKVATLRDSMDFKVPDFPTRTLAELMVNLEYENHLKSAVNAPRIPGSNPAVFEPDTLNIKFVLKDKAGNKSDTLTVPNIIVIR